MNKELLQKIINADRICKQANVHYQEAVKLEQQDMEQQASTKKSAKIKGIIAGVATWFVIGSIGNVLVSLLGNIAFFVMMINSLSQFGGLALGIILGYSIYKKGQGEFKAESAKRQKAIEKEKAASQQIFDNNVNDLAFLPVDYWYPLATEYLVKVVQADRANTLAEALSMFDEQLHRWKIEEANAEIVAQQKAQTANLNSIRKSSKVSAIANTANAIVNISSKL